jgi:PTH1 family peptidyl-tRNA hydrolase
MPPAQGRSAPVDWLLVGLGNPGAAYDWTPHNIGFMVAAALRARWGLGKPLAKYRGLISQGAAVLGQEPQSGVPLRARVALLEPQTFMNEAGRSVGPACGALRVPASQVVVVHDEIDLPFAEIRTRLGGGLAGHNGLKSVKAALGTADFQRVRVGVGRPPSSDPELVAAYVLGRFKQSRDEVQALLDAACLAVEQLLAAQQLELLK